MQDFLSNFKVVLLALAIGDTLCETETLVCDKRRPSSYESNLGYIFTKIVWRAQKLKEK